MQAIWWKLDQVDGTHPTKAAVLCLAGKIGGVYTGISRDQAAFCSPGLGIWRRLDHSQGSSSCRREAGRSAIRARMSASHALGSTSLRRQVVIIGSMTAARSAPRGDPAKVQFRRPSAMPRRALSAAVLLRQSFSSRVELHDQTKAPSQIVAVIVPSVLSLRRARHWRKMVLAFASIQL
jgi:hypothetical protein